MLRDPGGPLYLSYYLKKLDNQVQRCLYSLYRRREFQDCSLLNMWVCDYLFDRTDRPTCQKDVEQEFCINRATASKMLTLMEEKKLIRRDPSPYDGRQKTLTLLEKGVELHELCMVVRGEIEQKLTAALSPDEVRAFTDTCRKMLASLED